MKRVKTVIREERPKVTYARLECTDCHEAYHVRTDHPLTVLIPDFIAEGEFFTSECPICESGLYAMFITYIESTTKKETRQ